MYKRWLWGSVEGIHFRLDWTTPEDLGWKEMVVNLSDAGRYVAF